MSCTVKLRSGKNIGKPCGRTLPCGYHKVNNLGPKIANSSIVPSGNYKVNTLGPKIDNCSILPTEILREILSNLDILSKSVSTLVCKQWNKILGIVVCKPLDVLVTRSSINVKFFRKLYSMGASYSLVTVIESYGFAHPTIELLRPILITKLESLNDIQLLHKLVLRISVLRDQASATALYTRGYQALVNDNDYSLLNTLFCFN